ncbi:sentrin-specific protease 2 isoform X1 [Zea mays]|uniref:Ubiquitin-like protease family profile domain-containing protein n=1 Tax=Zea mays TaxID=4577 RepID=A0A804LK40_MAIZE|nr:sentrin-specific protease 2 isoform X1 [Zea mays]|eukprot:XP_020407959.1 sentrin-specific protease 2 isoform X1 [Zea mays]
MTTSASPLFPNPRKRHLDASPLPRHFHGPQSQTRLSQRHRRRFFLPLPPKARSFASDMGNHMSSAFGWPSDDGRGLLCCWIGKARGLTVAMDVEAGTGLHLVDRRRVTDSRKTTLKEEAVKPPQWKKRRPFYKEALEAAATHYDPRLEAIGIEIRLQKEKLAYIPKSDKAAKEVINLYLELLKEREKREPNRFLKCHFFNTFFYKKLACGKNGYDYKSVKRWTSQRKLGYELIECDKIFVPVHKDVHWCLAIINVKENFFQYLDSLGGMDHNVPKVLARYISEEVKDKSNRVINTSLWHEELVDIPLQRNGWDCGMFMLKYIDFHSRGLPLSFSQEHMEYFRKRTAKEILRLRAD